MKSPQEEWEIKILLPCLMWENNRYLISNTTTDDDLDELIRTVEDLQL